MAKLFVAILFFDFVHVSCSLLTTWTSVQLAQHVQLEHFGSRDHRPSFERALIDFVFRRPYSFVDNAVLFIDLSKVWNFSRPSSSITRLTDQLCPYSKHILTAAPYPITLTASHSAFAWLSTSLLRRYKPHIFYRGSKRSAAPYQTLPDTEQQSRERLQDVEIKVDEDSPTGSSNLGVLSNSSVALDDEKSGSSRVTQQELDRTTYWTRLVPAGALFAVSLVLSNAAYLYLSVVSIQVVKSGSPIAVLGASFAFGLRQPTSLLITIILLICLGSGIASYGAQDFNVFGVSLQVLAILVEATRLALTQTLLHGLGFGPLESIHATSPICLVALLGALFPLEGLTPLHTFPSLGMFTIVSNLCLAFALNVSAVYLIDLSSLVLSLSKVVKDILIIVGGTCERRFPLLVFWHHVG